MLYLGSSLFTHLGHHFLESKVASDSAANQNFFRTAVSHGSLCCFHKHRKYRFLQRVAQILLSVVFQIVCTFFNVRQDSRKGHVHSFDNIRQRYEFASLLGQLLNVIPWTGIIGHFEDPSESVQAVSHGNIDRLAKYSVLFL